MARNFEAPALVLRVRPVGENHRGLSMLVRDEGLLHPLAYGAQGRRSALRAGAVPYNRGIADLHYDGVKNRWRLKAFDPEETHDGLREDLDRFYTASVWGEILLGTHGSGGDSADLYAMAARAFSLLAGAEPANLPRIRAGFLWRFLGIEGVRPDTEHCNRCGAGLTLGGDPARYLPNGLLAGPECAESQWPILPDGSRRWLAAISGSELTESLRIGLHPEAAAAAERWLLTLVQVLLERPLRSLKGQASSSRTPPPGKSARLLWN